MSKQRRKNCVAVKRSGWEKDNVAHRNGCVQQVKQREGGDGAARHQRAVMEVDGVLIGGKGEKKAPNA